MPDPTRRNDSLDTNQDAPTDPAGAAETTGVGYGEQGGGPAATPGR